MGGPRTFHCVGTEEGEGLVRYSPTMYHFYCLDLFSRVPDGVQMQVEWRNTDTDVCLYWPDFLALPF